MSFSYQQWQQYQTIQLRKLLVHAYQNVPYYTNKFKDAGINLKFLENITLEDIKIIPITTKDDFRKYCQTTMLSIKNPKANFSVAVDLQGRQLIFIHLIIVHNKRSLHGGSCVKLGWG